MKVIAVVDERKTQIFEIEKPVPAPGEILVRIKGCAICTVEQRVFARRLKLPLPWVGGHEIAGVIEGLGDGVDPDVYKVGSMIAPRTLNSCGTCYYCRRGFENMCASAYKSAALAGTVYAGGMGEFITVKTANTYLLSDSLSVEEAVLTEPLACVINSVTQGKIEAGDDVVIIGGGVMGMLHILCAKILGARVILSEPDEKRAVFAKKLGADVVINPNAEDPVRAVKDISGGRGAEVVFNTTPVSALVDQGIRMTGNTGRFVQYSSMHPDEPVPLSPAWLHNSQAVLTGTKSPSIKAFDTSVNLLNKGIVSVKPLMTEVYGMAEADRAFERAMSSETFRVMIRF